MGVARPGQTGLQQPRAQVPIVGAKSAVRRPAPRPIGDSRKDRAGPCARSFRSYAVRKPARMRKREMKGIVFTEFLELVGRRYGVADAWS